MNLRHKKPINSYRGQANNDKNEFNDDDFKHQPSPSKKFVSNSGQQMYKYSRILAKFIMNANQYYREKQRNPRRQKTEIENVLEEAKITRDEARNSKYGKRPQQPKQKRKIMTKIQHEKLQLKQQKQKQTYKIEAQQKFQNEHIDPEPQKIVSKVNSVKTSIQNYEPIQQKIQPPIKEKNTLPTPQNFMNIYPQGIPMNGFANQIPNQNIMANMSVNQYMEYYNEMMRLSMLQQMIKNEQFKGITYPNMTPHPQLIPGMIQNPQLTNLRQNLYQNYMRAMPQVHQPLIPKKLAPIYNLTDVFLTKKQSIFNNSKQTPNQIVKRANFHIGLAYMIYLKQLQGKGIDTKNINGIDPIRQSRQIKQRQFGNKRSSRSKGKK